MYVKFIKEHPIGIEKDICKDVDHNAGERFIEQGYAEKIDEADYNKFKEDFLKKEAKRQEAHSKVVEKKNEKRRMDMAPVENSEGDMTKGKRKTYRKLTKADIEINGDLAEGFKVGDEVLKDDKGELVVVQNKLVGKN